MADEVRDLAVKSSVASKSTASLIENSLAAAENGTRIADAAAKSMETAVGEAGRVAAIVDRISQASGMQADSVTQVTNGIGLVDQFILKHVETV